MRDFKITGVIQDRTLEAISDGTEEGTRFVGHEADVAKAIAIAKLGWDVPMGVNGRRDIPAVEAGFSSPLAIAAAIMSLAPQSVYFSEAPAEVMELMKLSQHGCL